MGFGNNQGEWNRVVFFTAKSPKDKEPFFEVREGVGQGEYKALENAKWIEGYLYDIYFKEKEYENKPYKVLVIKLEEDPGQLYWIEFSFNYLGRDLMNRVLGLSEFTGRIRISLYMTDAKDGYDHGFPAVSFKYNNEPVNWKHEPKVLRDMIGVVNTDDGPVKQFKKLNAFMENEVTSDVILKWKKVRDVVLGSRGGIPKSDAESEYDMTDEDAKKTEAEKITPPDVDSGETDDLPF